MKKLLLFAFLIMTIHLSAQKSEFYNTNNIQDIQLTFSESNWAYLLDSLRTNGDGLLLGNAKINGKEYKNVGVRYRGTKSFKAGGRHNALYIKLNYINKKQNIDGHKRIKLSNAKSDPSMVREVLAYEIARNYMPAPEANYANVTINNKLYGLFVNIAPVDEQFLEDYYDGYSEGAFFKVNNEADANEPKGCLQNIFGSLEYDKDAKCYLNNFEMRSDEGWSDLIELSRVLHEEPENISKILNVDNTLWMLAFNNVIVNLDSYTGKHSSNFYLYQDKQGLFSPIVWDMNLCFGSLKNTGVGSDLKLKQLQELDPFLHVDNSTKPLISKLLKNEIYKKIYLSHMRTIMTEWFKNGKYIKRAEELRRAIQMSYINDEEKQYTFTEFQKAMDNTTGTRSRIPGIKELMDARYNFLKKHKSLAVLPPDISDVKVLGRKQFSKGNIEDFKVVATVGKYPKRVWVKYHYKDGTPYQSMQMFDDGKHNDEKANDGIFGATIPSKGMSEIKYYIQAENASIMGYSPSNYHFEQYSSDLKEVNK